MRAIKFRVWDKTKQQMTPIADISFGDDGSAETIVVQPAPKDQYYYGLVEGENGILMQFAGLQDKDSKDIYEGDIVTVLHLHPVSGPYEEQMCVVNGTYNWYLQIMETSGRVRCDELMRYHGGSRLRVIGNIYENPELVKR